MTRLQHAGHSWRKDIGMWDLWGETADHSRRNLTTVAVVGRWAGVCSQQLTVMAHTGSTRPISRASNGRAGRLPSIILTVTDVELNSLNGGSPVKT